MKKRIDILFVCAILLFLAAGFVRTVFFPKELNYYENRYAVQLSLPTVSSYRDGSFQQNMEEALADQVPGAQRMKSLYHRCTSECLKKMLTCLSPMVGLDGSQYVAFGGLLLFGDDYIVFYPQHAVNYTEPLTAKQDNLNAAFARHPELTFHVCYIEKDTDADFANQTPCDVSDYFMSGIQLPQAQKMVIEVNDFETFSKNFYRTDHHWNCYGSYAGYCQLVKFLGREGELMQPTGEAVSIGTFSGSKTSLIAAEGTFTEEFYAFPFSFPDMEITVDGAVGASYGNQDAFFAGTCWEPLSYSAFYGTDSGEVVFSAGTSGRGNLLVLGESFDNAVLKLLATHYDTLYAVDLRYYEHSMGEPFCLSAYTKERQISDVLLIGNMDYYTMDTFNLED